MPTWQGFDGFERYFSPCQRTKVSLSIGSVSIVLVLVDTCMGVCPRGAISCSPRDDEHGKDYVSLTGGILPMLRAICLIFSFIISLTTACNYPINLLVMFSWKCSCQIDITKIAFLRQISEEVIPSLQRPLPDIMSVCYNHDIF